MRLSLTCWMTLLLVAIGSNFTAAEPKPEWKEADPKLTKEALAAYNTIKTHMANKDLSSLARTLADNKRPLLPKDKQNTQAEKDVIIKLGKPDMDIDKTRQLLADVEAAKPPFGKAITAVTTIEQFDLTLVKIPLPGTKDIAAKIGVDPDRDTTDDAGNFMVLMVKHGDQWYWNPFGW